MAIETRNRDWRRFHDPKDKVTVGGATIHCADDAASLIALCANRAPGQRLKAAGSHWALSTATVSDGDFIETHWPDPDNVPLNSGLAIDMLELVNDDVLQFMLDHPPPRQDQLKSDPCLTDGVQSLFFVHLKSGTRVYEAYSLLDRSPNDGMTNLARKLNANLGNTDHHDAYDGPWAFQTLGGAGGQTVFGALTTGTHGGDYWQQPISDSVLAVHLITDGGAHYWIEPKTSLIGLQLTDDQKLANHYENLVPNIAFRIIRDDDVFNSVVVGAGRFGVVYSLVLRVVPQYCLLEHRRLDSWSHVKTLLMSGSLHHAFDNIHFAGTTSDIITDRNEFINRFGPPPQNFRNRFLQIAVNLSPDGGNDHLCGVSQRWFYPPSGPESIDPNGSLRGRKERGTEQVAGHASGYEPPDDTSEAGGNSTFISRACSSGNFIAGLFRAAAEEIEQAISDGAVPAGGIAVAALGIGAGAEVLAIAGICAILAAVALLLKELADEIDSSGDVSFAEVIDKGVKSIIDNPLIPSALGVMIVRGIFNLVFKSQQSKRDFVALSYAVMDTHDYLDKSCYGNAESVEVFFDAARPDLYCAYVDAVVSFEAFQQEQQGKFSVGYVSLRYMNGSSALLAPSRFPDTVAIEVAALRDASGSVDFVMNAAKVARHPMFNASFHWGQFNPLGRDEVRRQFGNRLTRWQKVLSKLTDGGARDGFSSEFTRQTGLEP